MESSPRAWGYLGAAVLSEVTGTVALRAAIDDPRFYLVVIVGYVGAFAALWGVLAAGMGVGVAYGIWSAAGVAITAVAAAGYLAAFVFLSLALDGGMPLNVAYGIWAAAGVGLTALAARLLFDEPLTPVTVAGLVLIGSGVALIELGAR